ncbi:hypothetical protein Cob_v011428 [Colletotrichum orbiculare MAFF 240422]|uniref:Uncharacterized protein n=1 Tax=Colletotrichum orbiculare (strain 104-T / ATCC 96160 / CBS 514.97 / LARS 414 / MAFF 240422) TaxID=1213857 RepID=A0A484FDW9_COLOR|nr:hypothetical protein Cob_v011428 [Colletotrichum orbiculare MAFF 240422]
MPEFPFHVPLYICDALNQDDLVMRLLLSASCLAVTYPAIIATGFCHRGALELFKELAFGPSSSDDEEYPIWGGVDDKSDWESDLGPKEALFFNALCLFLLSLRG